MFVPLRVKLDMIEQYLINTGYTLVRNDYNSCDLIVNVLEQGQLVNDLSGYSATIVVSRADEIFVSDFMVVTDDLSIKLPNDMYAVEGDVRGDISLYKDGAKKTLQPFIFKVRKDISLDGVIHGDTRIGVLDTLIGETLSVSYLAESEANRAKAVSDVLNERVASDFYRGLKGDKGEQGIQGIKGDKGDIGEQGIQGIQGIKGDIGNTGAQGESGTPKEVYATLSALQTAYPTGNTGAYVVTADGKWYFWNGSAWIAGGIYQATVIADGSITKQKVSSEIALVENVTAKDIAWNNKLYNGNFATETTGFVNVGTGVSTIVSSKLHLDFGKTNGGGIRLNDATNTVTSSPNKKILFRLKGLNDGIVATTTNLTYQIVNVADGKNQIINASSLIPNSAINDLLLFTVPSDWAVGILRVYVYLTFTTQASSIGYITLESWMALDLGTVLDGLYTYNYNNLQLDLGIILRGDYFQGIANSVAIANSSLYSTSAGFTTDGNFGSSNSSWSNVLKNPDGTNGTNSWVAGGSSTLSVSNGVFSWLSDVQFRAVTQKVDIGAGKTFKFEVEINAALSANLYLECVFYKLDGTLISQATTPVTATGNWSKFKAKITSPALAVYVKIGIGEIRATGFTTIQFRKPIMIIVGELSAQEQLLELDDMGGFWIGNPHIGVLSSLSAQSKLVMTRWTNKKWLSLGDSVTYRNQYQLVVMNRHRFTSYLNLAISGTQIGTMADNVTSVNIADKDLVTVFAPLNNFAGATQIGLLTDTPNKTGSFYAQCKYVISAILTLKPTIRLAFIGSSNVDSIGGDGYPPINGVNSVGKYLRDYINVMKDICSFYGIPFLNLYEVSGCNEFTVASKTSPPDMVHPNAGEMINIGYQVAEFVNTI